MSVSKALEGLNPEQREAVAYLDGPLLILAGPGSGKTRVITHKIAYLLEQGVPPRAILGVTFTNKAAEEMRTRVEALLGAQAPLRELWLHTFHAACARILRSHIEALSSRYTSSFTIFDEGDQRDAIARVLKELDISTDEASPGLFVSLLSRAKDELVGPDEFPQRYAGQLDAYLLEMASRVYRRYQALLEASNAVDFGDLLRLTVELFRREPSILERYRERFQYILIDEYQDINHAQYVFARALAQGARCVAVVGDEDQAIFSWRGSDPSYILKFREDFPHARVIALKRHYRWPHGDRIFKAAQRLIAHNTQRAPEKEFLIEGTGEPIRVLVARDELEEAQAIAREIARLEEEGMDLSQIAVLYRINTLSRVIEKALSDVKIPYEVIRGLRFYDRREVKDVLAYLKLLANPHDEISLLRALARPRRGVGEASLRELQGLAAREGLSLWEAMKRAAQDPAGVLRPKAARALQGFVELIEDLRENAQVLPLGDLAENVLERSGYLQELLADPSRDERLGNVRELIGLLRTYEREAGEGASLTGFLEQVALLSDADQYTGEGGRVALMTLHASKGLEFDVVFIVGVEENLLPHGRSLAEGMLEEERRLFYVGMTRARRRLYLSLAHRRTLHGNLHLNGPSRFLAELPEEDWVAVAGVG